MADRYHPKPALTVVREGNPGHQRLREPVVVPPAELAEPDWLDYWPAVRGDEDRQKVNARGREVARREWRRVVPVLKAAAGIGNVDVTTITDYCVCVARIDECERDISRRGIQVRGERGGLVMNRSVTAAGQYRTQLRAYIGELGLSPSARTRLAPKKDADEDGGDPFAAVG